ncbi:MAG: hypothetical protein H6742_10915 [Alphaproteobacteria bacterium]|nr:hypothetical protein [Alphaproteobacteria bacterium]
MYALSVDLFVAFYAAVVAVCAVVVAGGAVLMLRAVLEAFDPEVEWATIEEEAPARRLRRAA